jgi:hypothetical protein
VNFDAPRDMNQFDNGKLLELLENTAHAMAEMRFAHSQGLSDPEDPDTGPLTAPFELVATELSRLGLVTSARLALQCACALRDPAAAGQFEGRELALRGAIRAEMDQHVFFAVLPERKRFLEITAETELGADFISKYPSHAVRNDFARALRCFAFDEPNACAFHLMMVFEGPVKAFQIATGGCENETWGVVTKHYEVQREALKVKWCDPSKTAFFDESCRYIKLVANHWRNNTMHCRVDYGWEEALVLIKTVADLTRHVSRHLDEAGDYTP